MCGSSGTLNLLDFCFEGILVPLITLPPKRIFLLHFDCILGQMRLRESWLVLWKESLKPNNPWRYQNSLKGRNGTKKKLRSRIYRPKIRPKIQKQCQVSDLSGSRADTASDWLILNVGKVKGKEKDQAYLHCLALEPKCIFFFSEARIFFLSGLRAGAQEPRKQPAVDISIFTSSLSY